MWKKLVVLVGSVGLVLLIFELGFRVMGYEAIYDTYSKPSKFWEYHETLGWVHTPGSKGIYVGPRPYPIEFETPIEINSLGLRGPELEPVPPGGLRVLVTGDSHVAAFEIAYEKTFIALLARDLSARMGIPVQVINAGVRGYGTDQSLLYYRLQGRSLEPDVVLHVHSTNDARNNVTIHRMRRPFGKAVFRPVEGGDVELSGTPIDRFPLCSSRRLDADFEIVRVDSLATRAICRVQMALFDHSAFFTFVTVQILQNPGVMETLYALGSPQTEDLVDADAQARKREDAKRRYDNRLTATLLQRYAREVRADGARFLVSGKGMKHLDLRELEAMEVPVIDRTRFHADIPLSELVFENYSHYNERGHRIRAEGLAPLLEAELRMLERDAS